jgi:hypothetical protein
MEYKESLVGHTGSGRYSHLPDSQPMKHLNQLIVVPTISPCFQGITLSLVRLVKVRNVMLELYNQGLNRTAVG